jgi:hypothetical protein
METIMLAIILGILLALIPAQRETAVVTVIPPMPQHAPGFVSNDETSPDYDVDADWYEYEFEAFSEYYDEFTALFNSYETKWSKNGRLMMKTPGSKSFKFVAKGK